MRSRTRFALLAAGILVGLVLAYALGGAVLLPWLAKRELPGVAAEKWNARARVDDIAFNPFTLKLRVTGFVLEEKSGRPLLRLREANAVLEWRSLTRRGLVLSELNLLEPAARVEISEKGELNFAALGGAAGARPAKVELPAFGLGRLTVENGLVDFEDRREGYKNRFERLSLKLSSVSTVRGKGPYDLVAQMPDGGKLRWKGEVSITPLALTGTLVLEHWMLGQLNPYLRRHLDGRIASGRARVELPHRFALDSGKPLIEFKGATLAVQDLALVAQGAGAPQVKLKGATLTVAQVTLAVQDADSKAEVKGAKLAVQDFARVALGAGEPQARLKGATLTVEHVTLAAQGADAQAEVKGAKLAVEDFALGAQGAGEPQITVNGATLAVADFARVVQGAGEPQIKVQGAALAAQDLALAAQGAGQPFATVARLAIEGVAADGRARSVRVQSLRAAGYTLVSRRDAAGALHPSRMLPAMREGAREAAWQFGIGEVDFSGGTVSLADEGTGIKLALEKVTATAAELTSDTNRPLAFDVTAELTGGGRLAAKGKSVPAAESLEARVEVAGVPVALFQSLLARHAKVKIVSGQLAVAGELKVGGETRTRRGRAAKLVYAGAAALENVVLQDGAGAPLAEWKSLATKSLNLTMEPNLARIDELRWIAPKGKLEIEAGGTTNLGRLFPGGGEGAAPAAVKEPKPAADERKPAPVPREEVPEPAVGVESEQPDDAGNFPIRVRRVVVEKGTLDFSDQSIAPNFRAVIHDLAGTVNGLSTDRNTRSQLALEGRVDEYGYARVSGTLNAFVPRERTNIRVQFRNVDLAGVSPYTIKFAGYRIATGRLTLDLNYRVRDNRLEGDNHVVLDDFTLGERVSDGAAPALPLELAVSLLRDANGRIDLGIPISGSLDDPEFKLGDVFWKALGTILGNIIAAPFRALARLFGGGSEEVAAIAFEPGQSRVLPPEREKFKRIAEGLAQRPNLKVVVPARYDAEADSRALKREALRRELGKRAGFEIAEGDPAAPISIEDRRTRRALRELFAERFKGDELERLKTEAEREAGGGKPPELGVGERIRNFAAGEPQVADPSAFYRTLFRRLLEAQPIADGALAELAQKRAAAVAAGLQEAGVAPERVTQSSAEPTSNAEAKQVTLQLTLAPAG